MKKYISAGLLITATFFLLVIGCKAPGKVQAATLKDELLNVHEVERIEKILAADDMRGRKAFTPDIDRAADFIAGEFRSAGLQTWDNGSSFRQEFALVRPKFISTVAVLDGVPVDIKNIIVVTCQPELRIDQSSGYEKAFLKGGGNLNREAATFTQAKKNMLVMVDTSYASSFSRLSSLKRSIFKTDKSVVFVVGMQIPEKFTVEAKHEISEQKLSNVVGIIPGKSKKDEYVIFSGHYDHLGVGRAVAGDSIYNGANDDAAGTTAVIMLARHFKKLNNNERTLVFTAFTAEEIGGFGAQYFSRQMDAARVVAMFNIEMIGTESKWGKNSAYITGYEKTDMGSILQKNLEGTEFKFYPDPYTAQNLFYRSDNATLARLGVPAHTISTSKMDNEPNYHKVSDQVETLDMDNMVMIIKSIALSAQSIISGKDRPSRVKPEDLR